MNIRFDFAVHWLFAIVFAILAFSGVAMIGAQFGWLLGYDIALADFTHRVAAVFYILLTFVFIVYELGRVISGNKQLLPWGIFKPTGYGMFSLIITLLLMLSGIILWSNHEQNKAALAFAMFVHEKVAYVALFSVIWHIYNKAHALMWPRPRRILGRNEGQTGNLMLEPGFKVFIWALVTAYFFSVATIVIAMAGPQPDGQQVQRFMSGMMDAMDNSLMGLAMEHGATPAIQLSVLLVIQLLVAALVFSVLQKKGSGTK